MSNFYISDTHFGHFNIIKHCNRPFKTVEQMDNTIIQNWNKVVSDKDTVYILGDLAFSKRTKEPAEYLQQLKGRKIIIVGNHDYDISKNRSKYLKNNLFAGIYDYLEISDSLGKEMKKVILSHYPMVEWNGFFRGSIHLYGHIHNNIQNNAYKIMKNIDNAYNVGADILDFTPKTLSEVIQYSELPPPNAFGV